MCSSDLTDADATDFDGHVHKAVSGRVSWVAARNKYFMVAIIPREKGGRSASSFPASTAARVPLQRNRMASGFA